MNCIMRVRPTALILLVLFQMLLLLGCSQNDQGLPMSPSSNETITALSKNNEKEKDKKKKDGDDDCADDLEFLKVAVRDPHENGVTKKWIGPAGGVIKHGDHSVVIPAGALSQWVKVSFSMPKSDTLLFDLQPSSTQFNAPIKLVFEYDNAVLTGVDEENLQVVLFDSVQRKWVPLPTTVYSGNDSVNCLTRHFSRYAIIRN